MNKINVLIFVCVFALVILNINATVRELEIHENYILIDSMNFLLYLGIDQCRWFKFRKCTKLEWKWKIKTVRFQLFFFNYSLNKLNRQMNFKKNGTWEFVNWSISKGDWKWQW